MYVSDKEPFSTKNKRNNSLLSRLYYFIRDFFPFILSHQYTYSSSLLITSPFSTPPFVSFPNLPMLSRTAARLCLAVQSHISEDEKRTIVLSAMHNYELSSADSIGGFAFDLSGPAKKAPAREAGVLTDAVRTFANHQQAMGSILEGRAFPPRFDLSGVKISVPMARAYLPEANLEACTVCGGGSFAHAIMPSANLRSGSFHGVRFTNAVLQKCSVNSAKFHECDFSGCDMAGMDCRDAIFFKCVFHRANLFQAVANPQTSFVYPAGLSLMKMEVRGNPKVIQAPR